MKWLAFYLLIHSPSEFALVFCAVDYLVNRSELTYAQAVWHYLPLLAIAAGWSAFMFAIGLAFDWERHRGKNKG